MGRAILIICSGILVALGYIGYGSTQLTMNITRSNAGYAERIGAKNAAQTVLHMAMDEMYQDTAWHEDKTINSPWIKHIDSTEVHLYVEMIYEENDPDKYYASDTVRVVSTAYYLDSISDQERSTQMISVFGTSAIDEYVQNFKSGMTIATDNINLAFSGSGTVSGMDLSGQCSDKPAIIVVNEAIKSDIETGGVDLEGNVTVDSMPNFSPTAEMIDRLDDHADAIFLNGDYWGKLGTVDNPEVFIVESPSTISNSLEEGYGIIVFRSNGKITMEDSTGKSISLSENFTFNGLSVFENAYSLKGENVPAMNGSVVVMTSNNSTVDIDFRNGLKFQYDCTAEKYVKMAASELLPYKRFRRLSTFE